MATLTGSTIASTYEQLIKLDTETLGADGSAKWLETGKAENLPIAVSTNRVGIGTATPDNLLSLFYDEGTAYADTTDHTGNAGLLITNDDQGTLHDATAGIGFRINSGTENKHARAYIGAVMPDDAQDATNIVFQVRNAAAAFITPLFIGSTGKVGIGTTSPDHLLHISGEDTAILRLENTDTSLGNNQLIGAIQWEKADTSGAGAGVVGSIDMRSTDSTGTGAYMDFHVGSSSGNNAFAMRIDALGRVGMGVTDPDSILEIDVNNTQIHGVDGGNSGRTAFMLGESAGNGGHLQLDADDGDGTSTVTCRIRSYTISSCQAFFTAGNVGIGTTTPSSLLQVGDVANDVDTWITISCDTDNECGIIFEEESTDKWRLSNDCDNGDKFKVFDVSDGSTAVHLVQGGNSWVSDSDERIKKDIENISSALDNINSLRPITYKKKYGKLGTTSAGLIAQEVKPYFPLIVYGEEDEFELLTPTEAKPSPYKGAMSIEYTSLIPYLIKAIQELSAKVTALESK